MGEQGVPNLRQEYGRTSADRRWARKVRADLEVTEAVTRRQMPNDEADAAASTIPTGLQVLATPGAA